MKKQFALAFLVAGMLPVQAQTTALDFTANDCGGTPHTLFTELDEGYAVIIDLVMMGCAPCVTASHGITDNVIPNTTDPGRVKFYSIGYTNSISCSQMNSWQGTNGFTHPVFAGMSAQTTYYGGMGMPTIVVLGGGSTHTVYYSEQGYSSGDNPALIQALNDALAGANGVAEVARTVVEVSPNPATDVLRISGAWTQAHVVDLQGREVLPTQKLNGVLDVSMLQAGAYVVQLTGVAGDRGTARFEKR